jgi:predicted secreted Zn-dependent protease
MSRRAAFFPLVALLAFVGCGSLPAAGPYPATSQSSANAPPGFAGIPNITFDHYLVTGSNAAEVRRSLDARRPHDPNIGRRVDALTTWGIEWAIPGRQGGGCDLSRATVSYRARVQLPRLAPDATLSGIELERWRAFTAWLEQHEAWHARHAWDHVDDVLRAIRSSSCARAEEAASAAVYAIAREQLAFDEATRHGELGGVRFPY